MMSSFHRQARPRRTQHRMAGGERCGSETLALGNLKYCGKFAAQCEFEG
jgi:hypothetical protein